MSDLVILRQPGSRSVLLQISESRLGHFASIRRFTKLIRGSWFATVVVMSERSTEQIRELLDSLYRVDSRRILATLIRLLLPGCVSSLLESWTARRAEHGLKPLPW